MSGGPDRWLRGAEAVIQKQGMGQAGVKFQNPIDKQCDAYGKLGWGKDQVPCREKAWGAGLGWW